MKVFQAITAVVQIWAYLLNIHHKLQLTKLELLGKYNKAQKDREKKCHSHFINPKWHEKMLGLFFTREQSKFLPLVGSQEAGRESPNFLICGSFLNGRTNKSKPIYCEVADSGFSLQKYVVLLNVYLIHVQYSTNAFGEKLIRVGFFLGGPHFKTLNKGSIFATER